MLCAPPDQRKMRLNGALVRTIRPSRSSVAMAKGVSLKNREKRISETRSASSWLIPPRRSSTSVRVSPSSPAASRAAAKPTASKTAVSRLPPLQEFVWEGRDKRGVVMKGEQVAKNQNMLRAELRRQGINPTMVKAKPKPPSHKASKAATAIALARMLQALALRCLFLLKQRLVLRFLRTTPVQVLRFRLVWEG